MSCVLVGTAVVVWAVVAAFGVSYPREYTEAPRWVGAVIPLVRVGEPELHGPLELWAGDWWRIAVSPFHHGDLLPVPRGSLPARLHLGVLPHLMLNSAVILFLGRLLEVRVRRRVLVPMLLLAVVVPFVPEYLLGHTPVGLSGVAYAMFGLTLVLRRHDPTLQAEVSDGLVRFGLAWIPLGIVLTKLEVLHLANVAHAVGLVYGALWGVVLVPSVSRVHAVRVFAAAHVLLPVGMWFAANPVWNGRFHWYQSRLAREAGDDELRRRCLENAVQRSPSLEKAWIELAAMTEVSDGKLAAWRTILEALDRNRSSELLLTTVRTGWPKLAQPEQDAVREEIARRFGSAADYWERRLIPEGSTVAASDTAGTNVPPRRDLPVDPILAPPEFDTVVPHDLRAPEVDEDAVGSAALGRSL